MESFRIGKWEMIGWEFLPADISFLYKGIVLYLSRHLIFEKVGEHHLIRSSYGISLTY